MGCKTKQAIMSGIWRSMSTPNSRLYKLLYKPLAKVMRKGEFRPRTIPKLDPLTFCFINNGMQLAAKNRPQQLFWLTDWLIHSFIHFDQTSSIITCIGDDTKAAARRSSNSIWKTEIHFVESDYVGLSVQLLKFGEKLLPNRNFNWNRTHLKGVPGNRVKGKISHQATFVIVTQEPQNIGLHGCALATFPEYGWATNRHIYWKWIFHCKSRVASWISVMLSSFTVFHFLCCINSKLLPLCGE